MTSRPDKGGPRLGVPPQVGGAPDGPVGEIKASNVAWRIRKDVTTYSFHIINNIFTRVGWGKGRSTAKYADFSGGVSGPWGRQMGSHPK